MNQTIYIPDDIREFWDELGREKMLEFLRHGPKIFNDYVIPKRELLVYLEDKPVLKKLLTEEL